MTAIAGGLVGVALGVGTVATVAAASGAVVGGLPALAVAGGVILGTQVAVTGAVDAITGFMDPVPEIPPITPIGFTVFLLNGNDAKAAKEIEALFSVAKLFTKTAQGLEYALEAIKTGLEIYRSGKESQMPGTPMLPDQRRDAWSQTRILLGGRK